MSSCASAARLFSVLDRPRTRARSAKSGKSWLNISISIAVSGTVKYEGEIKEGKTGGDIIRRGKQKVKPPEADEDGSEKSTERGEKSLRVRARWGLGPAAAAPLWASPDGS